MTISQTGRVIINAGSVVSSQSWQHTNKSTFTTGANGEQIPVIKGAPTAFPVSSADYARMMQITGTDGQSPKIFTFPFRPLPIQHEGYGPGFNEIERPYDVPILDIKGGRLRKFNFDAPLSVQYDSINTAIDKQVDRLQEMADDGIPVRFESMSTQVLNSNWYIESLSIEHERSAVAGSVLRAMARISFVEYKPFKPKFIYLAPFSYGVPKKGAQTTSAKGSVTDPQELQEWIDRNTVKSGK